MNKGGITAEMREVKMDQEAMVRQAGRREQVHDPERSNRVSEEVTAFHGKKSSVTKLETRQKSQ